MNNNNGALNFNALLNTRNFETGINGIRKNMRDLSKDAVNETSIIDRSFSKLGTAIGAYLSAQALQGFVREIINIRGEFQKTEIAFETMLQDSGRAKQLMAEMVDLAAKTPFGLKDVTDGAKRLLAFQVPAEEVVETLQRMGDIAAGLGVPMGQLIHVYGQVKAQGRLMTNDLYQFMNTGIPMVAELAKVMGIAESKVKDLISEGKIGFPEVQKVISNLTDEGGMFFNLMEKQSASLSGKVANLMDNVEQMINQIGERSEGVIGGAIDSASYLVENYEKIAEMLGFAIATYGAYRVALLATIGVERIAQEVALQRALAQTTLNTAQATGAVVTTTLQRAMKGLTAAMSSNAVGLLITALGALAYVIYDNVTATDEYEESLESLKEKETEHQKTVDGKIAKMQTLIGVIKDSNTSQADAEKALNSLNKLTNNRISGLSIEAIRLGKSTQAIDLYVKMLSKEAQAKAILAQITENTQKLNREPVTRENTSFGDRFSNYESFGDVVAGGFGFSGESAYYRKLRNRNQENLGLIQMNENLNEKLKGLIGEGVDIAKLMGDSGDDVADALDDADKKTTKKLAEVFSEGSLAEIEQRISLWEEALKKSTGNLVDVLAKDKYGDTIKTGESVQLAEALKTLDELEAEKRKRELALQRKTNQELLDDAEKHWNNYYAMAEYYGKESADAQFSELTKNASSYLEYLNNILTSLREKSGMQSLSDDEVEMMIRVTDKIAELTGTKTQLQNWNDELANSLKTTSSLSEQIAILDKKIQEVTKNGANSNASLEFIRNARAQKEALQQNIEEQYNGFLTEQRSYEEKSLAITKKYNEYREQAMKDNAPQSVFDKIDSAESEEQVNAFIESMQNNGDWLKMFTDMNTVATEKLAEFREILVQQLKLAKNEADKIKIGEFVERIDSALRERNPFKALKDAIKGLGDDSKTTQEKMIGLSRGVEIAKENIGHMTSITNDVEEAFDAMGWSLDNTFGDVINSIQQTMTALEDVAEGVMSIVRGIASGNYIQAIAGVVQAVVGAVKAISSWLNGDKRREREIQAHQENINALKLAYRDLEVSVKNAFGTMRYESQLSLVENLRLQRIQIEQQMKLEKEKKKADKDKMNGYMNAIKDIDESIASTQKSIVEDVLQTDVVNSAKQFGDALVDAFNRGSDAAEELDNIANDLVRNMLKNQMSLMLQNRMKPILDNLLKSAGFNPDGTGTFDGLTDQEIADFKNQVRKAGEDMQGFLNAYGDIFKELDNTQSSLQGGIRREITEQTASELTGLFRAYYDVSKNMLTAINNQSVSIKSQVEIFSDCISVLQSIENNTADTVSELRNAVIELKGINKNTSKTGRSSEGMGL